MDIRADYTATQEDLAAAYRGNVVRNPVQRWFLIVFWLLVGLIGVLQGWVLAVLASLVGLAVIALMPRLYRRMTQAGARKYAGETSVRATAEGLTYAVGVIRNEIPWAAVTRVTDTPLAWAVLSNLKTEARVPITATVLKAGFTAEQRDALASFLATDPRTASKVRGPVRSGSR